MRSKAAERERLEHEEAACRLRELVGLLRSAVPVDGRVVPIAGVHLNRSSRPTAGVHVVYEPSLHVVVQGRKRLTVGDEAYSYEPGECLVTSVPLPVASEVIEASPSQPYLCIGVELEPALVAGMLLEVAADGGVSVVDRRSPVRAIEVSGIDAELLDAVLRLVKLAATPNHARVLAPLVKREIVYRLLLGEHASRLAALAASGGQAFRISKAISRLRSDFDQALRIEGLAREVGMSVSAFHHTFRTVTGLSPLQFQKRLRLQQARQLLLAESVDASTVATRVGYNDISQFNREYRRAFGAPPIRDVARIRAGLGSERAKAIASAAP